MVTPSQGEPIGFESIEGVFKRFQPNDTVTTAEAKVLDQQGRMFTKGDPITANRPLYNAPQDFYEWKAREASINPPARALGKGLDAFAEIGSPVTLPVYRTAKLSGIIPESFNFTDRLKWQKDIIRTFSNSPLFGGGIHRADPEDVDALKESFMWDEDTADALKDYGLNIITGGEKGVNFGQTVNRLSEVYRDRPLAEQIVMGFADPLLVGGAIKGTTKIASRSLSKTQFSKPLFDATNPITKPTNKLTYYASDPKLNQTLNTFDTIKNVFTEKSTSTFVPTKVQKLINEVEDVYGASSLYLGERFTDKFTYVNRLTQEAQKKWKNVHGKDVPFPDELHAEMYFALNGGMPSAAKYRVVETFENMNSKLGSIAKHNHVNEYLKVRHLQNVLDVKPNKQVNTAYSSQEKLKTKLLDLQNELGPEGYQQLEEASTVIRDLYQDLLRQLDEAKMLEPGLADNLTQTYPWYNPTAFVDDMGNKLSGTAADLENPLRATNPLRYMTEVSSEGLVQQDPLSLVFENVARITTMISENKSKKALIKTLDFTGDVNLKKSKKRIVATDISNEKLVKQTDSQEEIFLGAGKMKDLVGQPAPKIKEQVVKAVDTPDLKNTVSYIDEGEMVVYDVSEDAYRMTQMLKQVPEGDIEKLSRYVQSPFKVAFVTGNPAFIAASVVADSVVTSIFNGVLPHRVAKGVFDALADSFTKNPNYRELILSGGDVSGFLGADGGRFFKKIQDLSENAGDNALSLNKASYRKIYDPRKITDAIASVGHRAESGPRFSVFNQSLKNGLSNERAAFNSRRATVDFQRAGTIMKEANKFYLYSNVAMQGGFMLPRKLASPTTAKVASVGIATAIGLKIASYLQNRTYAEYSNVPAEDQAKFMLMLPSKEIDQAGNVVPHYITPVPISREMSLILAPLTNMLQTMDKYLQDNGIIMDRQAIVPMGTKEMFGILHNNFNPLTAVFGQNQDGEFSLATAAPPTQIWRLASELSSNKDGYRDKPITPEAELALPKSEQFDINTSEIAKRLSRVVPFNPYEVDHLIRQGAIRDMFLSVDRVVALSEEEDIEAESYLAELEEQIENADAKDHLLIRRRFFNQYLFNESRVLNSKEKPTGKFKFDALDMETRIKNLEKRKQQLDKIPFVSSTVDRFVKKRGGQLYETGLVNANKEFGTDPKQMKAFYEFQKNWFDVFGKPATLDANQKFVEYLTNPQKFRNEIQVDYSPQSFRQELATLNNAYRVGIDNFMIRIANGKENFKGIDPTNREEYSKWKETIFTVSGAIPDTRNKARILASGYKAIPINDYRWAPQQADPNAWVSAHKDWSRYHEEKESYKQDIIKNYGQEVLDQMLEITAENKSVYEISMDADYEQFQEYYGIERWLVKVAIEENPNYIGNLQEDWEKYSARSGDTALGYKASLSEDAQRIFNLIESNVRPYQEAYLQGNVIVDSQGNYQPTPEDNFIYQQDRAKKIEQKLMFWQERQLGVDGEAINVLLNEPDSNGNIWVDSFKQRFLE